MELGIAKAEHNAQKTRNTILDKVEAVERDTKLTLQIAQHDVQIQKKKIDLKVAKAQRDARKRNDDTEFGDLAKADLNVVQKQMDLTVEGWKRDAKKGDQKLVAEMNKAETKIHRKLDEAKAGARVKQKEFEIEAEKRQKKGAAGVILAVLGST